MTDRSWPSRLGWALFAMALVTNAVEIFAGSAISRANPHMVESPWFLVGLVVLGFYCCGFPLFLLMTQRIPKHPFGEKKSLGVIEVAALFLICMFLGYTFSIVGMLLSAVVTGITGIQTSNPVSEIASLSGILPMAVVAGICSPIIEEIVFRKIVLGRTLIYGEKAAVWFSATVFALLHMNLYQFFYALAIGVVLGHIAVKTGGIKYSIILHIMINLTGSVLMPLVAQMGNPPGSAGVLIMLGMMVSGFILWRKGKDRITAESPLPTRRAYVEYEDGIGHEIEETVLKPNSSLYLNIGVLSYIALCIAGFIYSVI